MGPAEEPLAMKIGALRPRDHNAGVQGELNVGNLDRHDPRSKLAELADRGPHERIDLRIDHIEVVVGRDTDTKPLQRTAAHASSARQARVDGGWITSVRTCDGLQ